MGAVVANRTAVLIAKMYPLVRRSTLMGGDFASRQVSVLRAGATIEMHLFTCDRVNYS